MGVDPNVITSSGRPIRPRVDVQRHTSARCQLVRPLLALYRFKVAMPAFVATTHASACLFRLEEHLSSSSLTRQLDLHH